jgi:hypothetical protein
MSVPKTFLSTRERIGCLQTVAPYFKSLVLGIHSEPLMTAIHDYYHQLLSAGLLSTLCLIYLNLQAMSAVADLIDASRLKPAGTHQSETILLHTFTPQRNGATLPH